MREKGYVGKASTMLKIRALHGIDNAGFALIQVFEWMDPLQE